jgi:hypothetical protein
VELERTTFETSRTGEYFYDHELAKQTGQPRHNFATVVLKELVDNALDACETVGVAPEVGIGVADEPGVIRLTVSDNGSGIPPETVGKILDFDVRVSDKAAYRSPTRGAQGNALKTVVGIAHALGGIEPVVVEACGIRHDIRAWVDPADELRVNHDPARADTGPGTRVTLALSSEGQCFDPGFWARSFALFNPHATVNYSRFAADPPRDNRQSYQGNGEDRETEETYKSTVAYPEEWRKVLPSDPTSPHWYDTAALKRLVFAHIAYTRRGGRDLPLGEFVRQFRGLSSTKKAKAVCAGFNGVGHLSRFEEHPGKIDELLRAMQEHSKAPSHNVLGVVGEEHFRIHFETAYDVEAFTYKRARGYFPSGLPFVFEFALAVTDAPGHLYCAINFSPTFGDPLEGTKISGPKFEAQGIREFLRQGHALPDAHSYWYEAPANVAVAAHIITPAPMFLDRGKSRLQLEEVHGQDI